jgi:hypothetical protein
MRITHPILKVLSKEANRLCNSPQKGTVIYAVLLFLLFALIVTPIQFHLDWIYRIEKNQGNIPTAFAEALLPGTLYFYAATVGCEGFFRAASNTNIGNKTNYLVPIIQLACFVSVMFSAILFLPQYHSLIVHGNQPTLSFSWCSLQMGAALLSFLSGFFINYYIVMIENKIYPS